MFSILISLLISCSTMNPDDHGSVAHAVSKASTIVSNVLLPNDYTAFPDVGFAYKFHPNYLTWNSARKQCATEGASLAIVDSFRKVKYITRLGDISYGHTGIHRLFDGIEWISVRDNKPPAFIPWKWNANLSSGTGQCIALWHDGSGVEPWDCTRVLPSVCEIPIFEERKTKPEIPMVQIDRRIAD